MVTDGGKAKIEKVGLDDEIRDGYDYEVTVALEIINDKHMVRASKDRTNLFADKPEFLITPDVGRRLLAWCNSGITIQEEVRQLINQVKTVEDLLTIFNTYPIVQDELKKEFAAKKLLLEINNKVIIKPQNLSTNGIHHS